MCGKEVTVTAITHSLAFELCVMGVMVTWQRHVQWCVKKISFLLLAYIFFTHDCTLRGKIWFWRVFLVIQKP